MDSNYDDVCSKMVDKQTVKQVEARDQNYWKTLAKKEGNIK